MRYRPTRRARDKTEAALIIEPVDLIDHAVNIVIERGAAVFNLRPMRQ